MQASSVFKFLMQLSTTKSTPPFAPADYEEITSAPAMLNGTGEAQQDIICGQSGTINAASSVTINLATLKDAYGDTVALARIKGWGLLNTTAFTVSGSGALTRIDGQLKFHTGTTPAPMSALIGQVLTAGGWFGGCRYDPTGWAGTGTIVLNNPGSAASTYTLIVAGASV